MENKNDQEATNTPEEEVTARKKWKLRYMLVLAAGLILIAGVFFLTAIFGNNGKGTGSHSWENAESARQSGKDEITSDVVNEDGAQNALAVDVPVDSYYQFANDYYWEDLYTLMIQICQSGVGLSEGSASKHPSFALFSFDTAMDPLFFVGFTDPNTGKSTTTLYITDQGYVYELLKVDDDKVYIDKESGRIMIGSGEVYYRYTPHVLLKTETGSQQIPLTYEELLMTDAINLAVTSDNIGMYLNIFGEGS